MTARYDEVGDVAIVTLDRPERYNAINAGLSAAVIELFERGAEQARAIVLTGAGKAFCAGADLAGFADEYEDGEPDLAAHLELEFHPLVRAVSEAAVPVVAAVNGVAAGAGMGLALGCDIRVMAESAYFTSAFTAIGLAPDSGSTWLLPQHLGVAGALEMALTNRRMSADEARSRGLCAQVAPDAEVVTTAIEMAQQMADLPTDALVTTRRLIRSAGALSFDEALEVEKQEQGRLGRTAAHREGVMAFLEKRSPDFKSVD